LNERRRCGGRGIDVVMSKKVDPWRRKRRERRNAKSAF
jgi:hypothetical protein